MSDPLLPPAQIIELTTRMSEFVREAVLAQLTRWKDMPADAIMEPAIEHSKEGPVTFTLRIEPQTPGTNWAAETLANLVADTSHWHRVYQAGSHLQCRYEHRLPSGVLQVRAESSPLTAAEIASAPAS